MYCYSYPDGELQTHRRTIEVLQIRFIIYCGCLISTPYYIYIGQNQEIILIFVGGMFRNLF